MRKVRDAQGEGVSLGLGRRERLLDVLQLGLHGLELLALLRRRLAAQLRPRAELVDPRDESAPARVGLEQPVEGLARALARDRCSHGIRIRARCLEVDHAREFTRTASITLATPSSCGPGHVQSAIARRRGCASSTATPNPATSRSSTSFSPSPKATTWLEIEPELRARRKRAPIPSSRRDCRARGGGEARS